MAAPMMSPDLVPTAALLGSLAVLWALWTLVVVPWLPVLRDAVVWLVDRLVAG